jgi:outer membrane protein
MALVRSEAVTIARAGAARARGQVMEAVAGWWPQLSANASYVRTLKSQYQALVSSPTSGNGQGGNSRNVALCTVQLDSNATPQQVATALQLAQSCQTGNLGGVNFGQLGFGSPNSYNIGLSLSQTLFNGQVLAASQAASAPRQSADVELTAQRAQVVYDMAQAYYDASLDDQLVTIAESTLVQSQRTYQQTSLARRVGTQSDFDLLQAQVTRDNQVPVVLQRRNDRDLAYYKLKQLLKLPLDAPVHLTTGVLDATALTGGVRLVSLTGGERAGGMNAERAGGMNAERAGGMNAAPTTTTVDTVPVIDADTAVDHRSGVREQQLTVVEYEALQRQAVYEYLPTLTLASAYSRVAYPTGGLPAWNNFLTNWTVGVYASVPIFNGFRTRGDVLVANANLDEQRARLDQERELAALDARTAVANLRQAQATWTATSGSVTQATHAYEIADLRYREGLSTLVELNDSRISEQQALANRAQAARNLQVARVRMALIRDLPLSTTAGSAGLSAQQSASQGSPSSTSVPPTTVTPPSTTPTVPRMTPPGVYTGTTPATATGAAGSVPQ